MKNKDIIEKILKYHPTLIKYQGCDDYKCGDPEAECTGVAVALVPTADVIRRSAEAGCNLLVVHEPIFYQTPDFPNWMGSFDNRVYEEKRELIAKTKMTVWRDHDHMHAHVPDAIFTGVIRELGWMDYFDKDATAQGCFVFDLPKQKIEEVANHLKAKLNLNGLKYVGKLDNEVSRVAIVGHLMPGFGFGTEGIGEDGFYHDYAMDLMKAMEEDGIELIIPGEIIEWTVIAYIRDAVDLGKNMSCLSIGHYNIEELGMKDFADRVRELMPEENAPKVIYVPTEDGFKYF